MRRICPKCGNNIFITSAHVMQDWEVDGEGNWLETVVDCEQIDHGPDPDNLWTCSRCGTLAIEKDAFPYDKNEFTIYCKTKRRLCYNFETYGLYGYECFVHILKTENGFRISFYDKNAKFLLWEQLYKRTSKSAIDEIPFILEALFGDIGKQMVTSWNENNWFALVKFQPDDAVTLPLE